MNAARPVGAGGDAPALITWLRLAATPTFAAMALLTAIADKGAMAMLCSAGRGFPLNGMAPMYLLMGLFHSTPWLKLIAGCRRWHPNAAGRIPNRP